MSEDYGMRITKMLFEAEPKLLACDPLATARASASLANVMGAVLATVLQQKGEATYLQTLRFLLDKIDASARATQQKAVEFAKTPEEAN